MKQPPFTPAQLDAVDVSRRFHDACVTAGPGSGKTTVLVEYFRRLVEAGVDPLRILAITFTEKAAGNMRKKLAEAFEQVPATRARLERAWVSTVHGFCARLLKDNAVFAGVDPEFQVADARDAWRMQQESIHAVIDRAFRAHPAAVRAFIRGLSSYEFEEAVLSSYDAMRGAGVSVAELAAFAAPPGVTPGDVAGTLSAARAERVTGWNPAQKRHLETALEAAGRIVRADNSHDALRAIEGFECNLQKCKRGNGAYELLRSMRNQIHALKYTLITQHYAPQRRFLLDLLADFDCDYRERKAQSGMLDFADLEEYAVRLLNDDEEARRRLRDQFEHVLMDEFQDTNGEQARLLALVRPPDRFFAVGDVNQSIFGFRHAEPKGFQDYREDVERRGRHLVQLADNFRSRPQILRAVETVLARRSGIEPRALVAGRKFDRDKDVCVEAIYAPTEKDEASWVAARILEMNAGGCAFGDIAVLVRNTEVIGGFTGAFEAAGIPYLVNSGRGFYETREVNDLTHLLRVMANPRDEISLAAVLRSPLAGISDEGLLGLRMMGDNAGACLMRLGESHSDLFGAQDLARLREFAARLRRWRVRREYCTFDRLLIDALDDCGYRPESGARGDANIDKFLAQARAAARRLSLDQFVAELEELRESNPREQDAPPEDGANAVKVMTVHSAKGLEFPVVFVAAIHKGIDTSLPVVAFSPRIGLGVRWRNPARREDKNDLFADAIRAERKQREEEESHRLLYVAMTRAEDHLVLSFSGDRQPHWAGVLMDALGLDLSAPRDEVVAYDGWKLRLLVAGGAAALTRREREHAPPVAASSTVDLPALTGQQDTNATVTELTAFASCPRKYYLQHYLGFEERPLMHAPEHPAANIIGTEVHQLLASWDKPPALSPGSPAASLESQALGRVFRESPLGKRAARAMRVEREFDFLMSFEDLVIRGQVDLWFEEGGELVIVDYKTDSVTAAQARERADSYSLQLKLYAIAVERVAARRVDRAYLHFLRPNTVVEVDLSPSLLDSPETIVREFQQAQSRLEFPISAAPPCGRCGFRGTLCEGAGSSF